jgi:hypothetical protein
VRPVLAACQAVELSAGQAVGSADLSEAALVVVESGVVLLENGGRDDGRRVVEAIAGPGAVLVAPAGSAELRALAHARLTAVSPAAKRALLVEPGAAAAITAALVAAVRDREESLANFARFPHAERVRGKLLQLARSHER